MEYLITVYDGDDGNKRKVISRHSNLDDALKAGKETRDKLHCMVSCISGTIDENGYVVGKYNFYNAWF